MTTTRWWWIRHAPVINPTNTIYGQHDMPADTDNPPAYQALARAVPMEGAVWLHTPLSRTKSTAEAIWASQDRALPDAHVERDLMEQSFGDWQGLSHEQIRARDDHRVHRFWLAPAHHRPPAGESFADLFARVSESIARLNEVYAGRDIVAVTHGGTIRAALAMALRLDLDTALAFKVDNLSLTQIDHLAVDGQNLWRVTSVNRPPAH